MKKLYFLLFTILISAVSFGQTTVLQESFETDGNGTRYSTSIPEFSDGTGDFFGRTNLNGTVEDPADLIVGSSYFLSGTDSDFCFAAMDIDAANATGSGGSPIQTLLFDDVDISTYTNLTFAMLVAEDDDGTNEDWDDGSSFMVEVDIDNSGTFTKILQFEAIALRPDGSTSTSNKEPALDTDFDGVGDGTTLSPSFQEFTAAIGSGSVIDIKLTFTNLKNGDEDIAIDNLRIIDGYVVSPTISVTAPIDGTVFAPGTTGVNVEFTTANLAGGETVDIDVNGTITTGVTSPFAAITTDGQAYNITVNLMNGASTVDFEGVDFSVGTLTTVADITALRADVDANGAGSFYEITGGSLLTHTDGFNDRKWIQDATISGVLIFDAAGVIATTYAIGDMITGLKGTTAISNGVIQFIPTEDSGVIASSGNPVVAQTVTIPNFNATPDDYESELIELANVTFVEGDGTATFATGQNYTLNDGTNTAIKRTDFFTADYIGTIIPSTQLTSVIGVAGEFNGTSQIYVRSLTDITLGINDYIISGLNIYPNPANTGFVNITSVNGERIEANVFDILGKQVLESDVVNNQLNVSGLNAGVYILKLTQNNATATKKLVIK